MDIEKNKGKIIGSSVGCAAGSAGGSYIGAVGVAAMGTAIGIPGIGVVLALGALGAGVGYLIGSRFDD